MKIWTIAFLLAMIAGGVRAQEGMIDIPAPGEDPTVTLAPSRPAEPHTVPSKEVDPCPTPSAKPKLRKSLGNSGPYPTDREELEKFASHARRWKSFQARNGRGTSLSSTGGRTGYSVDQTRKLNMIWQSFQSQDRENKLVRIELTRLGKRVGSIQGTMNKVTTTLGTVTTTLEAVNTTLSTVKDRLPENLDEAVKAITAREGIRETVQRLGSQRPATANDFLWMGGWQLIFAAVLIVAAAIVVRRHLA